MLQCKIPVIFVCLVSMAQASFHFGPHSHGNALTAQTLPLVGSQGVLFIEAQGVPFIGAQGLPYAGPPSARTFPFTGQPVYTGVIGFPFTGVFGNIGAQGYPFIL